MLRFSPDMKLVKVYNLPIECLLNYYDSSGRFIFTEKKNFASIYPSNPTNDNKIKIYVTPSTIFFIYQSKIKI